MSTTEPSPQSTTDEPTGLQPDRPRALDSHWVLQEVDVAIQAGRLSPLIWFATSLMRHKGNGMEPIPVARSLVPQTRFDTPSDGPR